MPDREGVGRSVLVIDDDDQLRGALVGVLEARGYTVMEADTGRAGLDLLARDEPDMAVLDLGLPDINGVEVCRAARRFSDLPILILTIRDDEEDKVRALDAGADDYLTKPFSTAELLARTRALLRRVGTSPAQGVVVVRDLVIDLDEGTVKRDGERVALTAVEWSILSYLAERAGRVVPSKALLEHVWGVGSDRDPQLLRVHVSNLRRKIEPDRSVPTLLLTEPGVGFRLAG